MSTMAQTQVQQAEEPPISTTNLIPEPSSARPRSRLDLDVPVPVNQNGSFEADRVLKSGYVLRRTRKTKVSGLLTQSRMLY